MEKILPRRETSIYTISDGLLNGGVKDIEIMNLLDQCFLQWAKRLQTKEMVFPPIISIEELVAINYFQDHPTQAIFLSALLPSTNVEELRDLETGAQPLGYVMNPAACYHAYLSQRNQQIDQVVRISTQTQCFRNQPPYSERRLRSFKQRKFAFIGKSQEIREILKQAEVLVYELSTALGLDIEAQPSQAPNYIEDPKLGKIKALFLADKEFIYQDLPALCHTNFHRNYFCKRLNIKTSDGRYAFAGCLGVIHEYWLLSLRERYQSDTKKIIQKLNEYLNN